MDLLRRPWRSRAVLAALGAALLLTAGVYAAWAPSGDRRSRDDALQAAEDRRLAPLIAPHRRRARAVEPVAGEVGGTPADRPAPAASPGAPKGVEGPRLAEGAASDAEVRRELARMRAASERYDFDQLDFSGQLVPWDALPSDGWRVSVVSVYHLYGNGLACGGVLRSDQLGVAHKTAPCGTMVTFRYGRRAIRVPVIDRGPFVNGREWDFTGATAAALGFPGLGAVEWHV